jgi:hypothetical protein
MSVEDNTPGAVHEAFAQMARADIELLLKQLTQDEKVALLTGMFTSPRTLSLSAVKRQANRDGIPIQARTSGTQSLVPD